MDLSKSNRSLELVADLCEAAQLRDTPIETRMEYMHTASRTIRLAIGQTQDAINKERVIKETENAD